MYWKMVWSALDGNLEEATKWLKMMKHELDENESVVQCLTKNQLRILKQYKELVVRGESPRLLFRSNISISTARALAKGAPFETERELNDFLFFNPGVLSEALNLPDLRIQDKERITYNGRMDLIGHTADQTVIIELKLGQADHAVVTQIEKYMRDEYRRLHYGFVNNVLGVVVAASYSDFAKKELPKINVASLCCKMGEGKLVLTPAWQFF